jgi:multiple sugar transport system permease protein
VSSNTTPPVAAQAAARAGRLARWRLGWRRHGGDVMLIAPFLALFLLFTLWPIVRSAWLSFTDFAAVGTPRWVGLANYIEIMGDERFWIALFNTLAYMFCASLLSLVLGLVLAVAYGGQQRSHRWARVAFFLPAVAGGVGVIAVWKWLASSEDYGLFNTVAAWIGAGPFRFLGDPDWTLPLLVMIGVWSTMGYNMVLFVAGMRGISADLYEAATLDGATPWQRFWYITLPQLRPTLLYTLITGMIGAFQVFYVPYILYGTADSVGGVLDSALMLVSYLFDHGFMQMNLGYASAVAWVLTMILFLLTVLNMRLERGSGSG